VGNRDRHSVQYRIIIDGLIQRRKELGLTQWDVARRVGIDQSQLSKLERGERRLDIIDYARFCAVLDMNPADLLNKAMRHQRLLPEP